MLVLASAFLCFALNSALAAPVASSRTVESTAVNSTHHHLARDFHCKDLGQVKVSYKSSSKRVKLFSSKAVLTLDAAELEDDRCVYPILSGWPGMLSGAVAVTPNPSAQLRVTTAFNNYAGLMALTGDLLQDKVVSSTNDQFLILNRSGKKVKETDNWTAFYPANYDTARPTAKAQQICRGMLSVLYPQIASKLRQDAVNGLVYPQLSFDQLLFSDDWDKVHITVAPKAATSNFNIENMVVGQINNLDIQPDDVDIRSSTAWVSVTGTCKTSKEAWQQY